MQKTADSLHAEGGKGKFRSYLQEAIGEENASVAFSALDEPASVSVRLNPFKKSELPGEPDGTVPWSKNGFFLKDRPVFTIDPFFHGGAYYVQDSSSMFVGQVLRYVIDRLQAGDQGRPLRVLDLCAAPGGKTTDAAASLREALGDRFILVANEVVGQRASVLASNVALWGDPCVVVTSDDPARFARMEGYFDIIIADVPCSGEGMFRKDAEAVSYWSEDNVRLCQARQRRIVADVWPALVSGGILIYSTCTFNRYENDDNAGWIAGNLGAEILSSSPSAPEGLRFDGILKTGSGFSLVPGFVRGEGQYCALLRKSGEPDGRMYRPAKQGKDTGEKLPVAVTDEVKGYFTTEVRVVSSNGLVKAVPEIIADEVGQISRSLHVIASGCAAGELKKNVIVPDADLALSIMLKDTAFRRVELDLKDALSFLQGNTLHIEDSSLSYILVCYRGLPLGFVKNLGTRCNNLHPKGRRIRMDIKF